MKLPQTVDSGRSGEIVGFVSGFHSPQALALKWFVLDAEQNFREPLEIGRGQAGAAHDFFNPTAKRTSQGKLAGKRHHKQRPLAGKVEGEAEQGQAKRRGADEIRF